MVSAEGGEVLSVVSPEAREALSVAQAATAGLARLFDAAGHRLFLVGGVVRAAVAGRFCSGADLDCTTDAPPATVRRIVADAATAVWTQGERFGTIGCVVDGRAFEITTHRAERYAEHSRKPEVAFSDDVVTDLARRDFTVNAMAVDTADGRLIDPYGGQDDLAAGVLRTPLDPTISFGDDPLRMLRAARFVASHGLAPDKALVDAVQAMVDRLDIVSVERIRDELEKLLLLDDPTEGFGFLYRTGLMERVIADLAHRNPAEAARVVAAVPAEPAARWAALFVGDTPEAATSRLRRLRCSNGLVLSVMALLAARARLAHTADSPSDVRRFIHDCRVPVDEALAFADAVTMALGEPKDRLASFAATLAEMRTIENVDDFELGIDGHEVMAELGIGPGPEVGHALAFLRDQAFEHGPCSKPDAMEALRRWWATNYCAEP